MATEVGRADPSVAELLFQHPYEFDFFQAVRLLGLCHPNRQLLSRYGGPPSELVRFCALLSLNFPPSAIYAIEDGDPIRMTVAFMGLTGPQGALPSHYTELLIARLFEKDTAAKAFLDLFNHRFVALFYQAWAKHNLAVSYERERATELEQGLTHYLFDLIGMGTRGLRGRLKVRDEALLLYAGLIAQRPHSASALRGMLEDYFQTKVEIRQFTGKWIPLAELDLSYLSPEGPHNRLGFGAIAGEQVWNHQVGFVVQLGPVTYERFLHFLPGNDAFAELVSLVRYFVGQALDFVTQLVLIAEDVPWCRLSDDADSPRLGWSSWLKTEEFLHDAQDTVIAVENLTGSYT